MLILANVISMEKRIIALFDYENIIFSIIMVAYIKITETSKANEINKEYFQSGYNNYPDTDNFKLFPCCRDQRYISYCEGWRKARDEKKEDLITSLLDD